MTPTRPIPNYSLSEVEGLVEAYSEIKPLMDVNPGRLRFLVRLWDLELAIEKLPPKEYQAVLLIGLVGMGLMDAGKAMGVSHETMRQRYRRGIELLHTYLNNYGLPQGLHQGGARGGQ